MSVLNKCVIHDDQLYSNSLDTYTLCTVHGQDSVVVRHERTSYTHASYTAHNMTHAYVTLDVKVVRHELITHLEDQILLLKMVLAYNSQVSH